MRSFLARHDVIWEPSSFLRLKQKRPRVKAPTCVDVRDPPPRKAAFELQCSKRVPAHRMSEHRQPDKIDASKRRPVLVLSRVAETKRLNWDRRVFNNEKICKMNLKVAPQDDKIWDAHGLRKRTLTATWSGLQSS